MTLSNVLERMPNRLHADMIISLKISNYCFRTRSIKICFHLIVKTNLHFFYLFVLSYNQDRIYSEYNGKVEKENSPSCFTLII